MRDEGPEKWRSHQGIKEMCGAVAGIQGLCNKWGILDEILPYCSHGMSRDAFDGILARLTQRDWTGLYSVKTLQRGDNIHTNIIHNQLGLSFAKLF